MTQEVRLDIGNNTIVCEVDEGKGLCQNFVDPDNFIFRQDDAVRKDIEPDNEFEVEEINLENKEVTFDQDTDSVMAGNLAGDEKEELEMVRQLRLTD